MHVHVHTHDIVCASSHCVYVPNLVELAERDLATFLFERASIALLTLLGTSKVEN